MKKSKLQEEGDGPSLTFDELTRRAILGACVVGMLAFGGIAALTIADRSAIERAADAFVIRRVESELNTRFPSDLPPGLLVDEILGDLPARTKEFTILRSEALRERLRARLASANRDSGAEVSARAQRILSYGESAYRRLHDDLIHELRLFAGSNAILFAVTALVTGWRRNDLQPIVLPAGILATTTCVAAIVYLSAQNWLWSFLTGDYLGYWYIASVGIVSALLLDIACNQARVASAVARTLWHWPP